MKAKNEEIWRDRLLELGEQENKTERRKILKNVVLISLGFLFNFTAYSVSDQKFIFYLKNLVFKISAPCFLNE